MVAVSGMGDDEGDAERRHEELVAEPVLKMPPPSLAGWLSTRFPLTVEFSTVAVPALEMPPPLPRLPQPFEMFPLTVEFSNVRVPLFEMPAPASPQTGTRPPVT